MHLHVYIYICLNAYIYIFISLYVLFFGRLLHVELWMLGINEEVEYATCIQLNIYIYIFIFHLYIYIYVYIFIFIFIFIFHLYVRGLDMHHLYRSGPHPE